MQFLNKNGSTFLTFDLIVFPINLLWAKFTLLWNFRPQRDVPSSTGPWTTAIFVCNFKIFHHPFARVWISLVGSTKRTNQIAYNMKIYECIRNKNGMNSRHPLFGSFLHYNAYLLGYSDECDISWESGIARSGIHLEADFLIKSFSA